MLLGLDADGIGGFAPTRGFEPTRGGAGLGFAAIGGGFPIEEDVADGAVGAVFFHGVADPLPWLIPGNTETGAVEAFMGGAGAFGITGVAAFVDAAGVT